MITHKVEHLLQKSARKLKTLQFAMSLPELGLDYSFSSTVPLQKFHSASVGKLATAALAFKAVEQGLLALDSPVRSLLSEGTLDRLFLYEGRDYQNEVTVKQLLGHTSGINDYFESASFSGASFVDGIIKQPDKVWRPIDLIDHTRAEQQAVGRPGESFFYSDTGYVLLGLVLEAVYSMSFDTALTKHIFEPAGMTDTCLCFHSPRFDPRQLAPLYLKGTDVRLFNSLSCDHAGGGLSTTAEDLLRLLAQLRQQRLIGQSSLAAMEQFPYRYRQGMVYGLGMMQLRFEQFFFLLKYLPRLQGHLGVTGAHAWYDPASGASYALNVGNDKDIAKSFKLLIQIVQIVHKEQRKQRA